MTIDLGEWVLPKLAILKPIDNVVILTMTAGFVQIFGGWDSLMDCLLIFIAVDYFTGVLVAVNRKNVSSKNGFFGLLKKIVILLLVLISAQVDHVVGVGEPYFRMVTCLFYISNEGISILENATHLGLPVPKILSGVLEKLKTDAESGDV